MLKDLKEMLKDLKEFLGITDTDRDNLLNLIISDTTKRLKVRLGGIDPPEELDYIIRDVSIIRFNRIGSEGFSSHSVEGESLSFNENDFAGYTDEIEAFLDGQKETKRGRVRFI